MKTEAVEDGAVQKIVFSFLHKISCDKARNNDFSKIESRSSQSSFGRAFDLDAKVEKLDFLLFGIISERN